MWDLKVQAGLANIFLLGDEWYQRRSSEVIGTFSCDCVYSKNVSVLIFRTPFSCTCQGCNMKMLEFTNIENPQKTIIGYTEL